MPESMSVGAPVAALRLRRYPVSEVALGEEAGYEGGRLVVAVEALRAELMKDPHFCGVDIALVAPNERARIINIVDVVEPRIKPGLKVPDYYPGVGTDPFPVGSGETNVLSGMTVMTTALLNPAEDMVVSCEPGQRFRSRFAECWNLVVSPQPARDVGPNEFARAVSHAGCRAAVAVARATLDRRPADTIDLDPSTRGDAGPRIGYICYLYSHGFGRQKFIYGRDSAGVLPTVMPITHLLDGALVDNGYTRPVRNSTYELANNAIARELAMGHGRDHVCAGLILVPHASQLHYKSLYARMAAGIAHDLMGCDGVVVSKDGGGQGDVDLMQVVQACEMLGIRAAAATSELAGPRGDMYPVVTTVEQADALVSLGNLTEPVQFGPIDRVVGGTRFGRSSDDPLGSFSFPAGRVPGLVDLMGGTRVRAVAF